LAQWGDFAASTRFEDLPGGVVDRVKLLVLDCIGVIAAGMQEPELVALTERMSEATVSAGKGFAAIGSGSRFLSPVAAFLNGTAGTMLELDEGNQFARGHPGIHVVPAALGEAELHRASGAQLIKAIAIGYEIAARIGIASKLRVTMHPHGTWGTVGAAVGAACVRDSDARRIVTAINVASNLGLATSRRTMLEGGTVRNTYAGFSNQLGLMALELVEAGFTGETDGISTVYDTVIADAFEPAEMIIDLGSRWEVTRNYFKRHAACRYTHGAIDALEEIMKRAGPLSAVSVESIAVETYVWAAQLDSPDPRNMLAAKFSLPFALATTIVHGAASVPAFRQAAVNDASVRDLARRVTVREDATLTAKLPDKRCARVQVRLRDGGVFSAEVSTNKGDTEDPYEREEIEDKFRELAAPVWGDNHAHAILEAVRALERARDLRALGRLLAEPHQYPNR
jgi:2-methylcitrate dehydratase PrpD